MHYIKAWQSLPEYGISLFVINFMGHKKEELLGVAFNRLMRMDINTGDHLRTWRYNSMIVSTIVNHFPNLLNSINVQKNNHFVFIIGMER